MKKWLSGGALLLALLIHPASAYAQTGISQGFPSDGSELVPGTLVSVKSNGKTIEAASGETADKFVGVVGEQSLLELSNADNQTQVVTSGVTRVLVSTINGSIEAGDKIAMSPLKGIGMKSLENGYVIGTAQDDMANARDVSTREVTDINGETSTVKIGVIDVQIDFMWYEHVKSKDSFLPSFLLQLAQSMAGKEVSAIRVLIALLVLIVGFAGVGILVYSSVRSSIISIGRNPLAAAAVHRGVLEVILLAIGVLLAVLGAVYMILVI